MRLIVRVVDEAAEIYPIAPGQMLEDTERADLFAFIGRERNAVTQEKKRTRLGQRCTNVNKGRA